MLLAVWLVKLKGFGVSVTASLNHFLCFLQYKNPLPIVTSKFHGKFHVKNRYHMNHEAMSAILVFQLKFTVEFTR